MKRSRLRVPAAWIAMALAGASCDRNAVRQVGPSEAPVTVVEVRSDGLGYAPGTTVPFSGTIVRSFADDPDRREETEIWQNGKRHGEWQVFYRNGQVKTCRRYEDGRPLNAGAFYRDGTRKLEVMLNAADKAEGPYRRWHPNGRLQAEASFDANEAWHGDSREWDEAGELISHHIFDRGKLVKTVFETPAAREAREAHFRELEGSEPEGAPD